ncbi:MAG: ABC transporter substrate-binding protein [Nakamurella sp.]
MRKSVLTTALVAISAAALFIAGCSSTSSSSAIASSGSTNSGDASQSVQASDGGSTVNILCLLTELYCQGVTKAYTADTGAKAQYVRLSTGEGVARLKLRKSNPEFDAVIGGPSDEYYTMEDEELLEKYISPNRKDIPDADKDADGYWTGMYNTVLGFCSNVKRLKELGVQAPASWQDLLNPKLKGLVGMADPSASGTAYTALYTQLIINDLDKDKAFDYFKQLNGQITQYAQTGGAPAQAAAQGEVVTGIVFTNDCVTQKVQGAGDNLIITTPSEGTGPQVGGTALVKGAPHPDAAKKLLDWILTPAGQDPSTNAHSYVVPTNPGAKVDPLAAFPKGVNIVKYDARKAGQAHNDLVKAFDDEIVH